jgi:outer membrane protein assembly factor BamB
MSRSAAWTLITFIALAGCATDGDGTSTNTAGGTSNAGGAPVVAKPTGLLIEPVDAIKLGYTVQWVTHINVMEPNELLFVVQKGDLLLTVERPNNLLTAIAMKDGKQLWRQQVGHKPYRAFAPTRVDNTIICNTETQLYEFDATKDGRLIDRSDLRSAVVNGPAMVGEMAVFGGADGMVFGHDTRVGYAKWSYKMPGQILVPALASGAQVFVAGIDGQYALSSGRGGEKLWDGRAFGAVAAAPAVHASGIYVPSKDHSLYALNRATGEDRWIFRYTTDLLESPIVLQNAVYQPLPGGEIVALKVTDGKEIWRLKTKDKLVAQDTRGLIFNGGDKLVLRDTASSKVIEQIPVKGVAQHIVQAVYGGIIVVSPQGRIMKLEVRK